MAIDFGVEPESHTATESLFPSDHLPARHEAARAKCADRLEQILANR